MNKLEISIEDLEALLKAQKRVTGEYVARNLTVYEWFEDNTCDTEKAKQQLKEQAWKSPYADDFEVLRKYIKP